MSTPVADFVKTVLENNNAKLHSIFVDPIKSGGYRVKFNLEKDITDEERDNIFKAILSKGIEELEYVEYGNKPTNKRFPFSVNIYLTKQLKEIDL